MDQSSLVAAPLLQEVAAMSFKPGEPRNREDVTFGSELGWAAAVAGVITILAIVFA
jgi:hypothetical protein